MYSHDCTVINHHLLFRIAVWWVSSALVVPTSPELPAFRDQKQPRVLKTVVSFGVLGASPKVTGTSTLK